MTYELTSPFVDLKWNSRPDHWWAIVSVWFVFWAMVVVGLIYLYAVLLPAWVGFETTVLVGIALVILGQGVAE